MVVKRKLVDTSTSIIEEAKPLLK